MLCDFPRQAILNYILIEYGCRAVRGRRAPARGRAGELHRINVTDRFKVDVPLYVVNGIRGVLQHYTCRGLLDMAKQFHAAALVEGNGDVSAELLDFELVLKHEAKIAASKEL